MIEHRLPKVPAKITNMRTALSDHARERAAERTDMEPEAILEMLHTGRAVQLNNPDRHFERRAYVLCFSPSNKQFFVAITRPAADARRSGTLVTILSIEQHEKDRGEIPFETKRRAARLAMGSAAFRAYEDELAASFNQERPLAKRDVRAALFFFDSNHTRRRLMLGSTKVPLSHLLEHGLNNMHTHPAFWDAIAERVTANNIPSDVTIDRVEVLVGDRDPVVISLEQLLAGQVAAAKSSQSEKPK